MSDNMKLNYGKPMEHYPLGSTYGLRLSSDNGFWSVAEIKAIHWGT